MLEFGFEITLLILVAALIMDWVWGEPDVLWSRFPHPVVLFGKAVWFADRRLNSTADPSYLQYRKGAVAIVLLITLAGGIGFFLQFVFQSLGLWRALPEAFVVFVLLAQRSLYEHVEAVMVGLREAGLDGGRSAVAMIVGRDPSHLDESGVSRASIESLAENFSDGVVAPAFWYAVFGLPGIFIYKMINTADSMIAYKSEKYLWFGRVAAQIDDLANWLPARLSGILVSVGCGFVCGVSAIRNAVSVMFRDAGLHQSPNAGWPEAAMAGGLGIALGGPRDYAFGSVNQSYLNASGDRELNAQTIERALSVLTASCFALWVMVIAILVLL